jgi:hypothetical protein
MAVALYTPALAIEQGKTSFVLKTTINPLISINNLMNLL